jgi:hypothetical protein
MVRQTDGQIDRWSYRQMFAQTDRETRREVGRHTDRWSYRQMVTQTERQEKR